MAPLWWNLRLNTWWDLSLAPLPDRFNYTSVPILSRFFFAFYRRKHFPTKTIDTFRFFELERVGDWGHFAALLCVRLFSNFAHRRSGKKVIESWDFSFHSGIPHLINKERKRVGIWANFLSPQEILASFLKDFVSAALIDLYPYIRRKTVNPLNEKKFLVKTLRTPACGIAGRFKPLKVNSSLRCEAFRSKLSFLH